MWGGDSGAVSLVFSGPGFLPLGLAGGSPGFQVRERPRHVSHTDSAWNSPSVAFPGLFAAPGPAPQSAAQPPAPEDAHFVQGVSPWPHRCHW
jgi:hypothetical protein